MVLKTLFRGVTLLLLVSACNTGTRQNTVSELFEGQEPDSVYVPLFANGFSISYFDDIKLVHINDPWDSTAIGSFVLVGPGNTPAEFRTTDIPFVEYPVTNWSAFSSTQVVFAEKLDVLETLRSVAEPRYISNDYIQKRLESGKVRDVGLANAADLEVLLDSSPRFVFVSPFKDNRYSPLTEAGLILINDAGYLEASPLGRAEWFVFFSAFFNKEDVALDIFKGIMNRYQSIRKRTKELDESPSVLTGTLFNDVWYMPAGDSYMARLFADAGASYSYSEKPGAGSLALDFETVFHDFRTSDYWVFTVNHPDGEFTRSDLLQMDERYADFEAVKNGRVLVSNTSQSLFFERGILEPDVVLKDLTASFFPELYSEYSPVYFNFLKE